MKIAYIYDVIYPETIGGVEKRIHEIGTRLSKMGHEVHLYGMKYWEGPDIIRRDGLIIHGVCPAIGLYTEGRRSILQAFRYTIGLIPHLLHADADIVDCQNFPYFPVVVTHLITRLHRKALVVTWHEYWGKYWFTYLGWKGLCGILIEKIALRCSPVAIAVSPLTQDQMRRAGYQHDLVIIPNGIDLGSIQAVHPSDIRSDLIFVARFIPEKHPELVVEAVHQLVSKKPGLRCLMIGDGPEMSSVLQLIDKYGLSEHIICTGFVADYSNVIALMKSSHVFILPSVREGFGIVAMEAMACGLSLITVDHQRNAASAHVLPGTGLRTTLDASDIARGVYEYLEKSPDQNTLMQYVSAHDWDTIAVDLETYYLTILNRS
ncbi:MAG: glycosyltransferase family 4 protein [Methanobacteriota archaeon]